MNLDKIIHQCVALLNNIEWQKTSIPKLWCYYAGNGLYVINDDRDGRNCYGFVYGYCVKEALDNYLKRDK